MPNLDDARRTYVVSLGFLPGRDELPILLNERQLIGCGIEVGVKQGEFSEHILRHWNGAHLISVDPWRSDAAETYVDIANVPQGVHEGFYEETCDRLQPFGSRSTIWRATSVEASRRIPHHSMDFVYLDARHDYDSVLEDLEAWFDKVRPGGILAGHDYIDGNFPAGVFGVRSAVDEFFGSRDIPVYSTLLDEPWVTWLVEIPATASALVKGTEFSQQGDAGHEPLPFTAAAAVPPAATQAPTVSDPLGPPRTLELEIGGSRGQHRLKLRLDPAQMSQRLILEHLDHQVFYEAETTRLLGFTLEEGDTFIDVGGHVGYFSMIAAALVGPQGKVFTFEPNSANFAHLHDHVTLNGFSNVELINRGVLDRDGTAQFFINADNDGGHAFWDVGRHDQNLQSRAKPELVTMDVVSLDGFFAGREPGRVRLIKIDAEGSEQAVLAGACELLDAHRPIVVLEINRFALQQMGTSEKQVRNRLGELGYETYGFSPEGTGLMKIPDEATMDSKYVFNLVFIHPQAALATAA